MKALYRRLVFIGCIVLLQPAYSTTILYNVSSLGGNSYEYTYTVSNNTLGIDIEEFSIFFDAAMFSGLSVSSPVSGWDELVLEPVYDPPFFVDDGLYDVMALGFGIAPGESEGGFSVSFTWLGSSHPGSQHFEVVNQLFEPIDSGETTAIIPIPPSLALFLSGLLGVIAMARRRDA